MNPGRIFLEIGINQKDQSGLRRDGQPRHNRCVVTKVSRQIDYSYAAILFPELPQDVERVIGGAIIDKNELDAFKLGFLDVKGRERLFNKTSQ